MSAIAVDFDGTLAYYDHWRGLSHCGYPICDMLAKVEEWHAAGHEVWIYSARLSDVHDDLAEAVKGLTAWCEEYLSFMPDMTGVKLGDFDYFFDDRAYHVEKNTGKITGLPEGL